MNERTECFLAFVPRFLHILADSITEGSKDPEYVKSVESWLEQHDDFAVLMHMVKSGIKQLEAL